MPTDIFPEIDIPVVTVIWQYTGLSTPEMEQRVTTYSQYAISSNVNGIKDIEAQTLNGISVQKIYFQPDVNLDLAIAQIVSATNSIRAADAAGHPAADRGAVQCLERSGAADQPELRHASTNSSSTITASTICASSWRRFTASRFRRRRRQVPADHGRHRPNEAARPKGSRRADIVNAVNAQNLTLPSGLAKIGDTQYTVRTNAMPTTIADLNNIPVKYVNGQTVFLKDVGQARDGWAGAAERRARRWPTLRPFERHQEWRRVDACRRRWGS